MARMVKIKGEDGPQEVLVEDFYVTTQRYLQPFGEHEPRLIAAAPGYPVKVTLPAKIKRPKLDAQKKVVRDESGEVVFEMVDQPEDTHLKRVSKGEPSVPKPSHPGMHHAKAQPAHDAMGKGKKKAGDEEVRAADKL